MKNRNTGRTKEEFSKLRHQAEEMLPAIEKPRVEVSSIEDAQRLIVELQVHQIELELQNDELRRTQEQLTVEREKYADLYNFAPVAYFTFDEQDIILDLNLTAAELLGNERKFLIGHPLSPYLTPASLQAFIRHRQLAYETKLPQVCELMMRLRDGNTAYVQARTVSLELQSSESKLWRSVLTDITERKRQEEKASYQAYLLDNVSDAIIATDTELRITQWNKAAEQLYGWSEAEVLGKMIDEVCQTEFVNTGQSQAQQNLKSLKTWSGELRQKNRNGSVLHINASVTQLEDASGNPIGGVTINHDITDRKFTEEALRESETRYRRLVENSPAIVYTFSNKRGGVYYSPVVEQVLGYTPQYLYEHPFLWKESIHPDDIQVVEEAISQSLMGKTFDVQYRVRNAYGKWLWLHDFLIGSRTEAEDWIIDGLVTDITDRKRIEKELQDSHKQLEATLDALPDIMFEVDKHGTILDFHSSNQEDLYFPHETFMGEISALGKMPADAAQAIREALDLAEEFGTSFGIVYSMETKNGATWFELSVAAVGDPKAEDARFIILARDITERKIIENDLLLANDVLQSHVNEIELLHTQLREQAVRDPLTGLFNRRYLQETLEREISRAQREEKPVGFIIMDIDHFKNVNDTYGHKAGDLLLQKLGGLISKNLRMEDIPCRYGGEEFTIIMPGASLEATLERASFLLDQINEMQVLHDTFKLQITASMGIAIYPHHGASGEETLIRADRALYSAKELGRNQIVIYQNNTNPLIN